MCNFAISIQTLIIQHVPGNELHPACISRLPKFPTKEINYLLFTYRRSSAFNNQYKLKYLDMFNTLI